MFDNEHLVSCAGLVPVMTLATQTGLPYLLANKIHIAAPRISSGSANPSRQPPPQRCDPPHRPDPDHP